MIAMPNSHLVLHKETLKQHFENKTSIKHLIKIINLGAINTRKCHSTHFSVLPGSSVCKNNEKEYILRGLVMVESF